MNLNTQPQELKPIASQLLAGMLANPHIYPTLSDEAAGQQEQLLVANAVAMAESLINRIDQHCGPHITDSIHDHG